LGYLVRSSYVDILRRQIPLVNPSDVTKMLQRLTLLVAVRENRG
jgi:hypothetical protein